MIGNACHRLAESGRKVKRRRPDHRPWAVESSLLVRMRCGVLLNHSSGGSERIKLVARHQRFFADDRGVAVGQVPAAPVDREQADQVGVLRYMVDSPSAQVALAQIDLIHQVARVREFGDHLLLGGRQPGPRVRHRNHLPPRGALGLIVDRTATRVALRIGQPGLSSWTRCTTLRARPGWTRRRILVGSLGRNLAGSRDCQREREQETD